MSEPIKRDGLKYICDLHPGDEWRVFGDKIWIINSDGLPRIIHPDGRVEDLKLGEFPPDLTE